jgi:hypothetical protein
MRNYSKVHLLFILFGFICQGLYSQTYILGQNGSEMITCGGTILDPGGNGPYANNLNVTQTFTSAVPGQCIQLTINSFATEEGYDFVRIYNGPSATGEPLLDYAGNGLALPMVLNGTAGSEGSVTIQFTTDGSLTSNGFSIAITCISCSPDPIIYTLGQGGSTITECGGILRDPGGTENYPSNTNLVQTFCSGNADCLRLTFSEFDMESGLDFIRFYDGNSLTSPLLDIFSGSEIPPEVITSDQSGGCMTIEFVSNGSVNFEGFKANFDCVPCSPPQTVYILGQGLATINTCGGILKDPGASGDYQPNLNVIQTFCDESGNCMRMTFDQLQTQNTIDIIRFYDGATIEATLIDEVSGFNIPPSVTSSTNSGGCMTVQFISDAFSNLAGFSATLSCVPCVPPPEVLILGQDGPVVNTCNVILQDPGGVGQYGNNLNITQTICSGTNECINLTFSEFNTEAAFDRLTVYDGPDNTAEVLGVFSGILLPPSITSSTESGGCMTLVFTTNGETTNYGWEALISCTPCQQPLEIPPSFCDGALPFCAGLEGGITYPASINSQSEFEGGICCLGSTPNPAWYYMRVEEAGSIDILISSGFDVDFMCWGPFYQYQIQNGVCDLVLDPEQDCISQGSSIYVDCSYSGSSTEICNIPNAQVGEYYMLLITNFSNQITNINFVQANGSGSTDCNLICDIEVQLNNTSCDSLTNTFDLFGQIILNDPPITGTLSIANSLGGSLEFSSPLGSTIDFEFENIVSNGYFGEVEIQISGENNCVYSVSYTAPESCSLCPVDASNSSPVFTGQSVSLNATFVPNATYLWSGPNGFSSTLQNPILQNATLSMQGIYTVTVFVDSLNCLSNATTTVLLDSTLGIDQQAAESDLNSAFNVIPNPASDQIIVSFLSAEEAKTIKIYDMNGRLVSSGWSQVSSSKYLLAIHDLPSGLYQVAVQTLTGIYFNRFAKLD